MYEAPTLCIECQSPTVSYYSWNTTRPESLAITGRINAFTSYTYYPNRNWPGFTTFIHYDAYTIAICAEKAAYHQANFYSFHPPSFTCYIQSPKPTLAIHPVQTLIPGPKGIEFEGFNRIMNRDFKDAFDLYKGKWVSSEEACARACWEDMDCVASSFLYRGCFFKAPVVQTGMVAGTIFRITQKS
ncbi:hypothetical protein HDU79_011064 [Rhizoclosmatium sp. JEL0117]|nr:hypothetical protein HDU79_011064 [Rhizoclosmatium sp. JEL0117]